VLNKKTILVSERGVVKEKSIGEARILSVDAPGYRRDVPAGVEYSFILAPPMKIMQAKRLQGLETGFLRYDTDLFASEYYTHLSEVAQAKPWVFAGLEDIALQRSLIIVDSRDEEPSQRHVLLNFMVNNMTQHTTPVLREYRKKTYNRLSDDTTSLILAACEDPDIRNIRKR